MDQPLRAPAQIPRALGLGAVTTALAVLAHGSTDGALPSPVLLAGVWLLLSVLALAAAHREWRLPALLVGLGAAQTGLHSLFVFSATGRWTHGGSVGWICCGNGAPIARGSTGVGLDRATVVQLLTRAVVVAVCAWWISRGEARVWTAARVFVRGVSRRLIAVLATDHTPALPAPKRARAPRQDHVPRHRAIVLSTTPRRGPPAPALCS